MLGIAFLGALSLYLFPIVNSEEELVATDNLKPLNTLTMDYSYDDCFQTEKSASFIIENSRK